MSESPPPAEPAQPAEPAPAPQAEGGKTSGLAIASLICGIVGLIPCCFTLPSIAALITGGIAMSKIKASGQGGKNLAIAGLVLGCIGIVIVIIMAATGNLQFGLSGGEGGG